MELHLYLNILRRHWPFAVVLPLLVALLSLGVELAQPARYGLTVRLLVTRGVAPKGSPSGQSATGEDSTAQDLSAIISSQLFQHDLQQELARQGYAIDAATLAGGLRAQTQNRVVMIFVTTTQPEAAVAIGQTAVALIQTGGLRYWGEIRATPELPGLLVGVLDLPKQAVQVNGLRAIAQTVALRTLAGLIAGIGLAFLAHYLRPPVPSQLPPDTSPHARRAPSIFRKSERS